MPRLLGPGRVLNLLKYHMVIATTLWEENTHPIPLREKQEYRGREINKKAFFYQKGEKRCTKSDANLGKFTWEGFCIAKETLQSSLNSGDRCWISGTLKI